jgi:hypothetical protein
VSSAAIRDPRSTIIGDGRGSSGIDSGSGFSSDRRRDAIRAAGVFAWARGALVIKLLRQPRGDRRDAAQAAAIVRARAADRIALAFCKPTGQRLRRKSACARAGSSRGWTARAKPAVRRWSAARRALIRILAGGVSPGQASRRSAPPNLGTVRGAADRRSAVDGGTKKPAAGIVDRAITPSARRGSSLGGGGADAEGRIRHLAAGTPLAARRTRQWPEAVRAITPPMTAPSHECQQGACRFSRQRVSTARFLAKAPPRAVAGPFTANGADHRRPAGAAGKGAPQGA